MDTNKTINYVMRPLPKSRLYIPGRRYLFDDHEECYTLTVGANNYKQNYHYQETKLLFNRKLTIYTRASMIKNLNDKFSSYV